MDNVDLHVFRLSIHRRSLKRVWWRPSPIPFPPVCAVHGGPFEFCLPGTSWNHTFFQAQIWIFWVLSILKHPAIVVSTVCPYPVVIQFCSCHAAFTEEDVGLCETLVPPNLMLYHRFTLFKYAVHIGVNPSLPDTPCRNLLNMVIDNGYLSHTVMSHSIQIMFRLAQCLSHFQTQTQQTVVPSWRCRRRRRNRIAAKNIVTWRNTTGVEFY